MAVIVISTHNGDNKDLKCEMLTVLHPPEINIKHSRSDAVVARRRRRYR